MKKILAFVLAGVLALGTCTIALAAPPTEAPSATSVEQDGKLHNVYVFGLALALVSEDGSIKISNMGPVGRVDVMIDGVVIKNVSSVDIPAGQRTKMALEEGSIIVKNVSAESGEAIKKQIEDAYAAGAASIDLASLTNAAAYKVNENGEIANADGKTVSADALEMSVASVDATVQSFESLMDEIAAEDESRTITVTAAQSNTGSSSSISTPSTAPSVDPSASSEPSASEEPSESPSESPSEEPTSTPSDSPEETTTPAANPTPTE